MAQYKTRLLQSHFDLVVQLYGDFSKIGEILKNIDDINGNVEIGTILDVPVQTDPTALFFSNNALIVQTDILAETVGIPTFDSEEITWDSEEFTFDMV